MTTNRPLSYAGLKSVIQFLDPNARFNLSQNCPSVQTIDRILPLTIQSLHLEPLTIKVNNTTYKLGIIRQYSNGKNPKHIQQQNNQGGVQYNVDCYGFPMDSENPHRRYEELQKIQKWKELEQLMKDLNEQENEEQIKDLQDKILPDILRRDKVQPPYDHFIQLTITSKQGIRIERVRYQRTIHEAMKYFVDKLFKWNGNEKRVQVTSLVIDSDYEIIDKMRSLLPINLKLRIRRLKLPDDDDDNVKAILNFLRPILANKGSHLGTLELSWDYNYNHPVIKKATKLIIGNNYSRISVLANLLNNRVYWDCRNFNGAKARFLIRSWQSNEFEIGKYYSIIMDRKEKAKNILKSIAKLPGAQKKEISKTRTTEFPYCVILPINNYSELNVSCVESGMNAYALNFKIQSNGFATPLYN